MLKLGNLSQKMRFPKVQSFPRDNGDEEPEEEPSSEDHLLHDPMIFKEGDQSLEGIQDYFE